jgi:hypothetical protein
MDIDVERSDLDVSGSGGATTRVWGVRHASEEVDLSTDDPLGTEGFEPEAGTGPGSVGVRGSAA